MIYCNNCSQELPNESIFCSKCGNKINIVEQIENDNIPLSEEQLPKNENLSNKSRWKIFIALGLAVFTIFGIVVYNNIQKNYNEHVQNAKTYVSSGDFDSAYKEIKDLSPHSMEQSLFEKIKMINYSKSFYLYDIEQIELNGKTDTYTTFEDALIQLTNGLKEVDINKAKELGIEKEMSDMKQQYLSYLKKYYGLSEEEALKLNIKQTDSTYVDGKKIYSDNFISQTITVIDYANSILSGVQTAKDEQEKKERIPLEIKDTKSKINGGYIYISGAVKNISSKTHSFVQVKVIYTDQSNNVVDTDWTYAVSSEGIKPFEQKYFEVMTKYRDSMSKYKVQISDFK